LRTFHFDLRHVKAAADDLQISVHGTIIPLASHVSNTLLTARSSHPSLTVLPQERLAHFTHFAEIDDSLFPSDNVGWIYLQRAPKPGVHLSQVVMMAQHIPVDYLREYYKETLELYRQPLDHLQAFHRHNMKVRPRRHSAKLASYGLLSLPTSPEMALEALLHAQTLLTPLDTAGSLVSHHPDLANTQPYAASVVYHEHVLPDPELDPDQFNRMQILSRTIENNPDWSPVVECKDQHRNPIKAGYSIDGIKSGEQLYTHGMADEVLEASVLPTGAARKTSSDDMRLQNKTWVPTPGTSVEVKDGASVVALRATAGDTKFKWTVDEKTQHHGVSVDSDSIKIDAKDHFSIDGNNGYARTLWTGYQLYNEAGGTIGKKESLYSISSVNSLLGIPMPTDPTKLEFDMKGATSVQLYFGSLGVTDWDEDFSTNGALLTGLWQYGIPTLFIILGKAVTSTKTFNMIVNDRDLTAAAIGVAFPIVGGGVTTAAALFNTKKILISFGNTVLSFIVQKGLEKLGEWLIKEAGKGAIASAFGPLGWVFKLAAAALNIEMMAITTAQALSSPANIKVKVSRAIDVSLFLHPDPAHGEVGNSASAVWPAVAKVYVATLQYKNGTSHQLRGEFPPTTTGKPIHLIFETVPAGGVFRIFAGVYSASGWLAGAWESDWIEAKPNQGSTLDLGKKEIKENLVPLAPDTQYVFKEKIVNKDGKFVWQAGSPPTVTRTALNCGNAGTVCELVGITINNSAFQAGYAWRSSGQSLRPNSASAPPSNDQLYSVQSLSMLENPDSRLKTTEIGFTDRPAIAYAPSTNRPQQIDQTNFVLDPRGGGMNLRKVLLDGSRDFGFGNTDVQSWGKFPLENVDALVVHPSNAVIAASWKQGKLMYISLPGTSSPDGKAPEALLVSGEGMRQGLLSGPKALAIAPDGRILVLESLNRRVQAFDIKGNPVPCFTPGPSIFSLTTSEIAADLDKGKVPAALQAALIESRSTFQTTIPASFIPQLDSAEFHPKIDPTVEDPLIKALAQRGVTLSYDPKQLKDPAVSAQIQVVRKGSEWILTDPRKFAWTVLSREGNLSVYARLVNPTITVEKPGHTWLVVSAALGTSWRLSRSTAEPTKTLVQIASSFFPLRGMRVGDVTYLDMAVEAQGYVYVLFYQGDGGLSTDYILDVYSPDGKLVLRSPDPSVTRKPENVVAGRMTVDVWRNLYGLTFESLRSPKGAPQPGVAHWMPTPPLFALDLNLQKDFNDRNIGVIARGFQAKGVTLSNKAFILVHDPEGAWEIKDDPIIYHIYRSGDGLQVYSIPA
jgi:hypothetical protein